MSGTRLVRRRAIGILTGFLCGGVALGAALAADSAAAPKGLDLSPDPNTAWGAFGNDYIAIPGGTKPVANDPKHPYVGNGAARGPGGVRRQVTVRVADTTNPILKPWAAEHMRQENEAVLKGRIGFVAPSSCYPGGVPGLHLFPGIPVYFVQTPQKITLMQMRGPEVRQIYLNVPHSKNVKPSWYGESVGHYEGDTLVVDTIGLAAKGPIDNWRTPHSDSLHVVERFRLTGDGKILEVQIAMEDPVAFTAPWVVMQKYRRVAAEPLTESICAENNVNFFNEDVTPIPTAATADF